MATRYWRFLDEATQNDLAEMEIENARECAKEIAHENLDGYEPEDLAWALLVQAGYDDEPDFEQRQADLAALIRHAAEQGL